MLYFYVKKKLWLVIGFMQISEQNKFLIKGCLEGSSEIFQIKNLPKMIKCKRQKS